MTECNASQSVSSVRSDVTEYMMLPHLDVLQYRTYPVTVVCTYTVKTAPCDHFIL